MQALEAKFQEARSTFKKYVCAIRLRRSGVLVYGLMHVTRRYIFRAVTAKSVPLHERIARLDEAWCVSVYVQDRMILLFIVIDARAGPRSSQSLVLVRATGRLYFVWLAHPASRPVIQLMPVVKFAETANWGSTSVVS